MALVSVTHKPITANARQFDGTYTALTDLMDARPKAGLTVGLTFDGSGSLTRVQLANGALGAMLTLNVTDWAVFPTDATKPAFVLTNAEATANWQ